MQGINSLWRLSFLLFFSQFIQLSRKLFFFYQAKQKLICCWLCIFKTHWHIQKQEHIHCFGKLAIIGLPQMWSEFAYIFSRAVKLVWFANQKPLYSKLELTVSHYHCGVCVCVCVAAGVASQQWLIGKHKNYSTLHSPAAISSIAAGKCEPFIYVFMCLLRQMKYMHRNAWFSVLS